MDYLGLLGSEDRARRFSEEVLDRYECITNIQPSQDDTGDDHDNHEYDDHIDSKRI